MVKVCGADDASRRPEDSNFKVDILTRCVVNRDGVGKKTVRVLPLKEPGKAAVVSLSLSQVKCLVLFCCYPFAFSNIINKDLPT